MKIKTEIFKSLAPSSLQVLYFKEITSSQFDHRTQLRIQLIEELDKLNPTENNKYLKNLSQRPRSLLWNFSLSHCPEASALAIIDKSYFIGIDCEVKNRINEKLIARISSSHEISNINDPTHLFCSKEAAWKALNQSLQVTHISQIETRDWSMLAEGWRQFKVSVAGQIIDGTGFLYEYSDTYLSIYYCRSTFS